MTLAAHISKKILAAIVAIFMVPVTIASAKDVKDNSATLFHETTLPASQWSGEYLSDVAPKLEAGEVGRTTVDYSYTYSLGYGDAAGQIVTCEVVVVIGVALGKWEHYGKRRAADREWDRFIKALAEHEQGHVDIAKRLFDGASDRCLGKTPDECNAALAAIMERERIEQAAFDRSTHHGIRTGASLKGAADRRPR